VQPGDPGERAGRLCAADAGRDERPRDATSSWSEGSVTWGTQPSVAATASTSVSVSGVGFVTLDVTGTVNDVVQSGPTPVPPYTATVSNFGWMLADEGYGSTQVTFAASESSTSVLRPKLAVTYAY
jgi:hypothetical protein